MRARLVDRAFVKAQPRAKFGVFSGASAKNYFVRDRGRNGIDEVIPRYQAPTPSFFLLIMISRLVEPVVVRAFFIFSRK
jgi:hypothetical protein